MKLLTEQLYNTADDADFNTAALIYPICSEKSSARHPASLVLRYKIIYFSYHFFRCVFMNMMTAFDDQNIFSVF